MRDGPPSDCCGHPGREAGFHDFACTANEPPFVCPGGRAVNVDRDRWVAQCPNCAYTFSTLTDDPVLPPHYVTADGVTFSPKLVSDAD